MGISNQTAGLPPELSHLVGVLLGLVIKNQKADAQAARQYLVWALEEIEGLGDQRAARHARFAFESLLRAR